MASANRRPTWRRLALGPFAVGLIVVGTPLLLPAQLLPETNIWDKAEHAGIFAGLTTIGLLAFSDRGRRWRLAFGLIAFGSTCEILQIFVPGREAAVRRRRECAGGVRPPSACAACCAARDRRAATPHREDEVAPLGGRGHRKVAATRG